MFTFINIGWCCLNQMTNIRTHPSIYYLHAPIFESKSRLKKSSIIKPQNVSLYSLFIYHEKTLSQKQNGMYWVILARIQKQFWFVNVKCTCQTSQFRDIIMKKKIFVTLGINEKDELPKNKTCLKTFCTCIDSLYSNFYSVFVMSILTIHWSARSTAFGHLFGKLSGVKSYRIINLMGH